MFPYNNTVVLMLLVKQIVVFFRQYGDKVATAIGIVHYMDISYCSLDAVKLSCYSY